MNYEVAPQSGIPMCCDFGGVTECIMDVPPSPDHVFDFPEDALAPHLAYDFFAPGPITGYAGAPGNMNGWIEEDGHLRADLMEPVVDPMIDGMMESVVDPVIEG
ncbi:hypothetical protein Tco_1372228 [Tanacetum coccineum]